MVNIGMVFAMIFTVIIIALVLAVGMNQITDFFCLGSNAQANKAVKDIESLVGEVFLLSSGSGKSYPLSLPSDVKVCFINKTNPGPHPYTDTKKTWNPGTLILENFLQNPTSPQYGSNIWIYYCGKELGDGYKMKYLSPSKSFCAPTGSKLYIENTGPSVDITTI